MFWLTKTANTKKQTLEHGFAPDIV